MLILDIIIACCLGYALYKGFKQGLIISIVSLFSLLLGIFIALKFSFLFRNLILEKTQWNANLVSISAFVFTFLLVLIGIQFLGKILTKVIKTVALGGLNRILGAIFSVLKMILIISVVLNLFQKVNYNHFLVSEEKLKTSIFYLPIEESAQVIFPLMKEWYEMTLENVSKQINHLEVKENINK